MSRVARALVRKLLSRQITRKLVAVAAIERPDVLLGALGFSLSRHLRFTQVENWPSSASSFEDVAPLVLSSNPANRGLAAMSLAEAAHLWRLAREVGSGTVVEIGRERGGSTFLLAAALAGRGALISYDPQTKLGSSDYDEELRSALTRYGIEPVTLSREDSHQAALPAGPYALVLVDGDPSFEGTRLDFERFGRRLQPGGHILFHDAVAAGPRMGQLAPLLEEIEQDDHFARCPDVGTFAHFIRRD